MTCREMKLLQAKDYLKLEEEVEVLKKAISEEFQANLDVVTAEKAKVCVTT